MKRIIISLICFLFFQFSYGQTVKPVSSPTNKSADPVPTSHFTNVNGIKLHYVTCGNGPAVILLHGWPFTWMEWKPVMIQLAKAGYTAIAPDLRGMGDSEISDSGYSKINIAEDIHQLVQQLNLKDIHLVGIDIGMMVAYAYTVKHQDEVKQLVLGESLIPGFGLEELTNPATGGYWHFGFHAQADLAAMLTAGKEAAYLNPMYDLMSPDKHIDPAVRAEYIRQYSKPGAMKGGFQHYATLIQDGKDNRSNFKTQLTIPVLVLNGEKGIPSKQTFDCVAKVASNVEYGIVPNSGHALGEDNPVWYTNRLVQFFNK
ncbi:alpha/beta fold hydrolase [Chryseobacterium vrystaatense]|uniref:Pimeloyl-ACP methyl ester carboxylesterase n=1 Tax=Chryseobacterium vrystaatense TaxID=307480 RepID=A0A1M5BUR4_9FLAO|nr:alpha/beta hydrolase [Chryseobacterium vrystaatense]SHF46303.1 Pimeloyl-ACP methyl ester carboxylesterase [Chryseobacterium vrystaatense]